MHRRFSLLIAFLAPVRAIETKTPRHLPNKRGLPARISQLENEVDQIQTDVADVKNLMQDADSDIMARVAALEAAYATLQAQYVCLEAANFEVNAKGDLIRSVSCNGSTSTQNMGSVVGPSGPQGPTGRQGPAGPAGPAGERGECSCTKGESDDGANVVRSTCRAHYNAGFTSDGFFTIDPDGPDIGVEPFQVWCDQTTSIQTKNGSIITGGWTLYAYHRDGQNPKNNINDVVSPNELSISTDEHWVAIRDSMEYGMMFIDEKNRVSAISKDVLNGANCHTPKDSPRLTGKRNQRLMFIDKDCNAIGLDYCLIVLSARAEAGAALYGYCGSKVYDVWPYPTNRISYEMQNELKYFIG